MNTNNAGAQQIIELYKSGHSISHIERTEGASYERVKRILTEAGVPLRSREESLKLAWTRRKPSRKLRLAKPARPAQNARVCALCGGRFTDDDDSVKGTTICRDCLGSVVRIAKRQRVPLGEAAIRWREGALP